MNPLNLLDTYRVSYAIVVVAFLLAFCEIRRLHKIIDKKRKADDA